MAKFAPPQSRFRSRRGFSLIELLTTFVIVGILALILVPAVQSMRSSSNAAVCTSNLRSIGLAIKLFFNDNGDPAQIHQGYDSNGDPLGPRAAYFSRLVDGGYVDKGARVFYSPANQYPSQYAWQTNRDLGIWGVSYGWNLNVHNGYASGIDSYSLNSATLSRYPILVTMDTSAQANSNGASVGSSLLGRIGYLHQGRANVLFPGGNVELKGPEYLRERRNWSPLSSPPWD